MVYATPLSLPIFASKVLDAIYIARAEISESIVVKAFGVLFSQVHSQPNNGINRIFVVVVITAQDDAIRLLVAFKVSVAIVNQPFRVHIEYAAHLTSITVPKSVGGGPTLALAEAQIFSLPRGGSPVVAQRKKPSQRLTARACFLLAPRDGLEPPT